MTEWNEIDRSDVKATRQPNAFTFRARMMICGRQGHSVAGSPRRPFKHPWCDPRPPPKPSSHLLRPTHTSGLDCWNAALTLSYEVMSQFM